MLKVIVVVAVVLAVALAAVLAYAATKPDTFRVARTASIKAPPEQIFPLVNDLRGWGAWSPYEQKDPAMKRTFDGPPAGRGAVYAWDGDKNVGQGRMEIVEASPPSRIVIKLDFLRPFEGHNTATFTMAPAGDATIVTTIVTTTVTTTVTWAMDGPALFVTKVIGVFLDMDKMIGTDFEAGLANLKMLAEK